MLKRIFGIQRMANFKAVMRLFRHFTQNSNEAVMDSLYGWMLGQIAIDGIALDVDSTAMTRYDQQEGAAQGFLSHTRQRLGKQPIALLRGDSGLSDNAFLTHLEEHKLHYVIALRQTQPLQRALVDARRVHRH